MNKMDFYVKVKKIISNARLIKAFFVHLEQARIHE